MHTSQKSTCALIYPHQLYQPHPAVSVDHHHLFLEDPLLFSQFSFHRQKLMLHRASMRRTFEALRERGFSCSYHECRELEDPHALSAAIERCGAKKVFHVEVDDDWLDRKIVAACLQLGLEREVIASPNFLTEKDLGLDLLASSGGSRTFFTSFYVAQRKRLEILLDQGKPVGGQWSFDTENRKKLPKNVVPPALPSIEADEFTREAEAYVKAEFPDSLGEDRPLLYASSRESAEAGFQRFLDERFSQFGIYEDAISAQHETIYHSLLTPTLNIGLLSPQRIVDAAMSSPNVPMNSLEGFLRQIIGWREYIRLVYHQRGRRMRTKNFLEARRSLPKSFYDGSTGILPFDTVIKRVLKTGYCHHIERLMVLGNFMLLCEIHPDAVYRWFMELFIDSYDWVMVPNVYGMSQYADGGSMTTKPYLSGSNYLLKMSDYPKGEWCSVWDGLYWRFIDKHRDLFATNSRMQMMASLVQKMESQGKLDAHLRCAEDFLSRL